MSKYSKKRLTIKRLEVSKLIRLDLTSLNIKSLLNYKEREGYIKESIYKRLLNRGERENYIEGSIDKKLLD